MWDKVLTLKKWVMTAIQETTKLLHRIASIEHSLCYIDMFHAVRIQQQWQAVERSAELSSMMRWEEIYF
jgi:hypothetical protein